MSDISSSSFNPESTKTLPLYRVAKNLYKSYNGVKFFEDERQWFLSIYLGEFIPFDWPGADDLELLEDAENIKFFNKRTSEYHAMVKEHRESVRPKRVFRQMVVNGVALDRYRSNDGHEIFKDAKTPDDFLSWYRSVNGVAQFDEFGELIKSFSAGILIDCGSEQMFRADDKFLDSAPVKIGIGHLPKGTKFKINDDQKRYMKGDTFTVNRIVNNGCDSWLIKCEEKHAGGVFDGETFTINVCHVNRIIKRGDGGSALVNTNEPERGFYREDYREYDNLLKKGEIAISRSIFLNNVHLLIDHIESYKLLGRYTNPNKIMTRLMAMGLARPIDIIPAIHHRARKGPICENEPTVLAYAVKLKEARKFLKKNPQWVFHNLTAITAFEEAQSFRDSEAETRYFKD